MAERQLSYCAAEVQRHDPDRFMTALFAHAELREALCVLYAFNLEVAKTREVVSEIMIGRIRLQWWREAIAEIYVGNARAHAVARPLADLISRAKLSRSYFERLIDARELDLEDAPPSTLDALEAYAEGTSSTLVALALEALDAKTTDADAVSRPLGIAWALVGLLRAVPFHAQRRRLYLPQDLMDDAGVNPSELFEHGRTPGLPSVVRAVASRARRHLALARRYRAGLPRAALPALLPGILADGYLAELRRAGYDPFALDLLRQRPWRPLRLLLASALGRY
ncbi:MAG TPA: phytoene/squalene synthase family protein [Alphaproteobacteria bacterium]